MTARPQSPVFSGPQGPLYRAMPYEARIIEIGAMVRALLAFGCPGLELVPMEQSARTPERQGFMPWVFV